MTKKLKIIGPYTPDHEGPFCLDDEARTPVELKISDGRGKFPLKGYVGDDEYLCSWSAQGRAIEHSLMNAREVPVAREFWIVGNLVFSDENEAKRIHGNAMSGTKIIHVREVLQGEGE